MTAVQQLVTILVVAAGTVLTRTLPFLLFPAGKPTINVEYYTVRILF
jgi:branched-subunit amino acid transport protein AzlD